MNYSLVYEESTRITQAIYLKKHDFRVGTCGGIDEVSVMHAASVQRL